MISCLIRLRRDETGATMLEYGLIAALIAVVLMGVITAIGLSTSGFLDNTSTSVRSAASN